MDSEQLTSEEIKKCIEEFKPVGFEIRTVGEYQYLKETHTKSKWFCDFDYLDENNWDIFNLVYPLFLQRVIEGINRLAPNKLTITLDSVIAISNKWDEYIIEFEPLEVSDQAKTQAIKYILNHLTDKAK